MAKPGYDSAEVLITVKTYPSPSATYEETVCVAGVRLDGPAPRWIRLYPVLFRNVEDGMQFGKYELVSIDVQSHGSKDPRIESHRPDQLKLRTIRKVPAGGHWPQRRNLLGNLVGETTTCELIRANRAVRMNEPSTSLGLIKPSVRRVLIEAGAPWTPEQLIKIEQASQPTLFGPGLKPLEPMPYSVRYEYRCQSEGCPSHTQKVLDWELGQAGRRWRREYGDEQARRMIKQKWEDEMLDTSVDTHFYIGNQHQHRHSFSVLGIWYPKYAPAKEYALF